MSEKPSEILKLLRQHHVRYMPEQRMRVLAAKVLGYSQDEIGCGLAIAPPTVKSHDSHALATIYDPIGLTASHERTATWFWQHIACCSKQYVAWIENDSLLDIRRA